MKGTYDIRVENARVQFKLTLRRSLTVIRGASATGKTTLVNLVAEHEAEGPASGVALSSPKPCRTLSGRSWQRDLAELSDSFVFIDEGSEFLRSNDFARAIKGTDNYYVIVSRESLPALPYSVEEVYELKNATSRYPGVRKFYTHARRMYATIPQVTEPQRVIVEDSNAGFEFFRALCDRSKIPCESAHGKGNVLAALRSHPDERVLVIADGAAFGPHMEMVLALARRVGAGLFLPESFEHLILQSGLIRDAEVAEVLADPAAFIESRDYFSWETFFTSLLAEKTRATYLSYSKRRLNSAYLQPREFGAVESTLPDLGMHLPPDLPELPCLASAS